MRNGLYNEERRYNSALSRLKKAKINQFNKEKILEFDKEYSLKKNITYSRRAKYLLYLRTVAELTNKNFNEFDDEEFKKLYSKLKELRVRRDGKRTGRKWSYQTVRTVIILFTTFSKWLFNLNQWQEIPFMKGYDFSNKDNSQIRAREVLNQDDVNELINACMNIRDKTLIKVLWESGFRQYEILNLRIEDLKFKNKGVELEVNGKTGCRTITLVESVNFLKSYMEETGRYKGWLFVKKGTEQKLDRGALRQQLLKIKKRTKLNKKVNPHWFRHSRASYLAGKFTEPYLRKFFGWSPSSKMPSHYVHLNNRDLNEKIYELYGISEKEEEQNNRIPCSHCGMLNTQIDVFCSHCGTPMSEDLIKDNLVKIMPLIEKKIEQMMNKK